MGRNDIASFAILRRRCPFVFQFQGGWAYKSGASPNYLVKLKDSRGQGFQGSSEMIKNYKELKVWQKAYQLCIKTYKITKDFPKEERYGLTSQIRRSAVSVPSNIAEGYGRKTTQEYIQALYIAYGSNCELETQILLSGDLKNLQRDIGDIERMLKALIKSLKNKHLNP